VVCRREDGARWIADTVTDGTPQDHAFETALDQWAVDHLEAAIALHKLVVEAMKTTGYRHIGKAMVRLEVPEDWHPEVYAGRKRGDQR
jgi:hypothetical protein